MTRAIIAPPDCLHHPASSMTRRERNPAATAIVSMTSAASETGVRDEFSRCENSSLTPVSSKPHTAASVVPFSEMPGSNIAGLRSDELAEAPVHGFQLRVGAALDDAATLEDDDLVGVAHGRKPMRDDQARHAPAPQVLFHRRLARGIERAGRLVEDQDRGIAHQRARDLEALPLAAGEVARALLQRRVQPVLAHQHLGFDRRIAHRMAHGLVARGLPEREVLAHGALEEHHVLVDEGDALGEMRAIVGRARRAVEEDLPAPWTIEARGQASERRLARARSADESDASAGRHAEREILDERRFAAVVSEGHVAEFERARDPRREDFRALAADLDAFLDRVVQDVVEAREIAAQRLQLLRMPEEVVDGRRESREEHLEGDEIAHAEGALHDERGAEPEHCEVRHQPQQRGRLADREEVALRANRGVDVLDLEPDPLEEERALLP